MAWQTVESNTIQLETIQLMYGYRNGSIKQYTGRQMVQPNNMSSKPEYNTKKNLRHMTQSRQMTHNLS